LHGWVSRGRRPIGIQRDRVDAMWISTGLASNPRWRSEVHLPPCKRFGDGVKSDLAGCAVFTWIADFISTARCLPVDKNVRNPAVALRGNVFSIEGRDSSRSVDK